MSKDKLNTKMKRRINMCVAFYSRKSIENLIAGGMLFKDWAVISFYDVGDDENRVDYSGVCNRVMYIAIDDIDREELLELDFLRVVYHYDRVL